MAQQATEEVLHRTADGNLRLSVRWVPCDIASSNLLFPQEFQLFTPDSKLSASCLPPACLLGKNAYQAAICFRACVSKLRVVMWIFGRAQACLLANLIAGSHPQD